MNGIIPCRVKKQKKLNKKPLHTVKGERVKESKRENNF